MANNFLEIFLMLFPLCAAFIATAFHFTEKWDREDRNRNIARVDGRDVIRDEHGTPLMYIDSYEMPCRQVSR